MPVKPLKRQAAGLLLLTAQQSFRKPVRQLADAIAAVSTGGTDFASREQPRQAACKPAAAQRCVSVWQLLTRSARAARETSLLNTGATPMRSTRTGTLSTMQQATYWDACLAGSVCVQCSLCWHDA